MAKGSAWMVAIRLTERSLGIVSTLLLARFLVPEDFGLIAMAMSIVVTLELVSAFSFDITLIQAPHPEQRHYDTAFTLNVLFRSGIALAMVLLAMPAASFYDEPRLAGVMAGLAPGWLALAFESIATVNFRRELQFGKEFWFQSAKRVVSFVVTLAVAVAFRSYWALVAGMVVGRVTGLIMSYILAPYRPKFTLSASRELMSFSVWLFLNNILYVSITRMSSFVVGKLSGSYSLGIYNIAREIGMLPTSELIVPIERALLSGYSRMAADREQLREGFLIALSAVTLLTVPAAFGIAAVAEPLVIILLSAKWTDAIPLLKVLGFLGAASALATNTYPVYVSIGRPRITTMLGLTRLGILIPAMFVLVHALGAVGAAWAELGTAMIMLPIGWYILCRVLNIRLLTFTGHVWRPILSSVLMYATVREYLYWTTAGVPDGASLLEVVVAIVLGAIGYGAILTILWFISGSPDSIERKLVNQVWLKLHTRGAS